MVCGSGYSEKWRDAAVLPQRTPEQARRLRTADGIQPEEDDLRGWRRHRERTATQSVLFRADRSRPGAVADQKSISRWILIRVAKAGSMLGSGGVVVLDDTTCMVKFALAHDEVLPARKLRMVHSLSRRYRLAEEDADALPCRRRCKERYRQHVVSRGKHAGPNVLSAGRCGGNADHRIREKIPDRSLKIIWTESRVRLRSKVQRNPYPYSHSR